MENILNSIGEWWRERRNSSLYFTFILFVILWNWETFYLLFISEPIYPFVSNFQIITGQYVTLTNIFVFDWFITKITQLLPPALLTFLSIVYLPKLNDWAHDIELTNYFARRLKFDQERAIFEEKRTVHLKKIAEQKELQKVYKDEIDQQTTEKEKWQNEFADLANDQNSLFPTAMSKAIDTIYYRRGGFNQGEFGKELLDLLLGYQVITVQVRDGVGERLEFTKKGEEFAKMFTSKSRMG